MILRKCGKSVGFVAEQRTIVNVSCSRLPPGSVTVHGTVKETCRFSSRIDGCAGWEGACRINRQGEPLVSFANRANVAVRPHLEVLLIQVSEAGIDLRCEDTPMPEAPEC